MVRIAEFDSPVVDSNEPLLKEGLILVEGHHVDNKGRHHDFSQDKLHSIVDNTNKVLSTGRDICVYKEHKKDVDNIVGQLDSELYARIITEDDVLSKKYKHLIGKLGIFAEDIAIKAKDMTDKVASGLAGTLSPGIDMVKNVINEISLTSKPAITGLSLFNMNMSDEPLSWNDLEHSNQDLDEMKDEYRELSENFLKILCGIYKSSDDALQQNENSKMELIQEAFTEYINRLSQFIGFNEKENEPPNANQLQQTPEGQYYLPQQYQAQRPGFSVQGLQNPSGNAYNIQDPRVPASYSLADVADVMFNNEETNDAEFQMGLLNRGKQLFRKKFGAKTLAKGSRRIMDNPWRNIRKKKLAAYGTGAGLAGIGGLSVARSTGRRFLGVNNNR